MKDRNRDFPGARLGYKPDIRVATITPGVNWPWRKVEPSDPEASKRRRNQNKLRKEAQNRRRRKHGRSQGVPNT